MKSCDILEYRTYQDNDVPVMKMIRVLIQLPQPLKAKLDALRKQGTTASGLIRNLVEQHFATAKPKRKHAG
jgi:metal-responsive CopG/Arc/MetJ family transcriptional regulator